MKRAVATITVYVYGENENELRQKAMDATKAINEIETSFDADCEKLHLVPYGKIGHQQEIKLN